jgi:hypothetical protein
MLGGLGEIHVHSKSSCSSNVHLKSCTQIYETHFKRKSQVFQEADGGESGQHRHKLKHTHRRTQGHHTLKEKLKSSSEADGVTLLERWMACSLGDSGTVSFLASRGAAGLVTLLCLGTGRA